VSFEHSQVRIMADEQCEMAKERLSRSEAASFAAHEQIDSFGVYRSQCNLLKISSVLYDVSDIIFTSMIYNSQSVRMFKSVPKIILAAGVALA
jgi:hypothetical protein